jgi:hypothetical protein
VIGAGARAIAASLPVGRPAGAGRPPARGPAARRPSYLITPFDFRKAWAT